MSITPFGASGGAHSLSGQARSRALRTLIWPGLASQSEIRFWPKQPETVAPIEGLVRFGQVASHYWQGSGQVWWRTRNSIPKLGN